MQLSRKRCFLGTSIRSGPSRTCVHATTNGNTPFYGRNVFSRNGAALLGQKTLELSNQLKVGVVGLGYVGMPLAVEFARKYKVFGYDIDQHRIEELKSGFDRTNEVSREDLCESVNIRFSSELSELSEIDIFIVTVPTPVDSYKQPDLSPLKDASAAIGAIMKVGAVVVFESTVFPGATEEVCVPILEASSSKKLNEDFYVGYSPERINPGDRTHKLPNIVKVTSGSTPEVGDFLAELYGSIIKAGIYQASSIKVAEAAKVIENTQRDVNIALINELSLIFERLDLDTLEVLEAAGTKWNFLPFKPGLVGGHCIGVDPYYLTYKAQEVGYHPEVILAGRRINDEMGQHIVAVLVKEMIRKKVDIANSKVLVMGLAFKENCPDVRNSRVYEIIENLRSYSIAFDVFDPVVKPGIKHEGYFVKLVDEPSANTYDAIVVAVGHDDFKLIGLDKIRAWAKKDHVVFDVKGIFDRSEIDLRL